ncbi:MAG: wax ester/triacylglycerol synthase family O-acyltransferase [Chloroflexi bacterium]|nr:wax ester/triacylglycerol synthase family O-acyltransferase [Chloroflexota bacterium]
MPSSTPLSLVDTAWYQMEDPTNLMMVTSVMLFRERVEFEKLKQLLAARLLKYDRFTMKVVESNRPLAHPQWERDSKFNLNAHVQHIALPAPGGQAELQAFASTQMSTPLDFSKSPWQITLVDNFGEGSAVFVRFHHCMADGMAGVQVLFDLSDFTADAPLVRASDQMAEKKEKPEKTGWNPFSTLSNALNLGRKVAGAVIHEGMEAIFNPSQAWEKAQTAASRATEGAITTAQLLLLPPDPPTPFKGALGVQKLAAWSRPLPLEDVRQISQVLGGKINDVLLSAMAGALRRYLVQHRAFEVEGLNVRAAVPVNLRSPERASELGNEFGLVLLPLPVGELDPLERMKELKRRMDAIKDSPEALITFGILGILGMATTPAQVAEQFMNIMGSKATAVATNVPGPRFPLYFAGKQVDNIMFWVPQSGRLGLGISIFSYNGQVTLGVGTDAGLIPDPDHIIEAFYEEFESLLELVRQAEVYEEVPATADHCHATTKAGTPCKNKPLAGSTYCRVHSQ